jgi:hypothetical protein
LFTNANTNYAFGLDNVNFSGAAETLSSILNEYSAQYEQYRIRRVRVRAQVGKGFTNDRRIQTFVAARVDVDNQLSGSTPQNVNSLLNAENTVVKTFTERGNVLLGDFRPQMRAFATVSLPILPNQLNWYPIKDRLNHDWKGMTVAYLIPEPTLAPNTLGITLMCEIEIEFRGRITTPSAFNLTVINSTEPVKPLPMSS